jgi:methionine-rich copper-binding protein CopC
VELWFSERLEPAFSTLSVWSAAGAQVDRQDAAVGSDDARRLSVTLADLEPGVYTVRFRVLSVDGHVVESSFTFTVTARP